VLAGALDDDFISHWCSLSVIRIRAVPRTYSNKGPPDGRKSFSGRLINKVLEPHFHRLIKNAWMLGGRNPEGKGVLPMYVVDEG